MMLSPPVFLLMLSVALPLVLALPMIRQHLPRQRLLNPLWLSLLPAAILALLFNDVSLELPWLFFGSGLAMDSNNRWLVFMLIAIWLLYYFKNASEHQQNSSRETFLLLCLSMSMATVLSVDLLGFFIFSSIMGYTFYAVVFHIDERHIKASGMLYIICLVLADIALFDALLIAAHTGVDLDFKNVQISMADSATNRFYLFMVIIGFALRAAIWPFQFWLSRAIKAMTTSHASILLVLPVAIALLGLLRWLPIEQDYDETFGLLLKSTGLCAIAYALIRLISSRVSQLWSAWFTLIYSGSFISLLGWFLSTTHVLSDYATLVYAYIAIGSLTIAALHFFLSQRLQKNDVVSDRLGTVLQNLEHDLITYWHKRKQHGHEQIDNIEASWRLWRKSFSNQFQVLLYAKHSRTLKNDWHKAILLLAFLGLLIAWLR